MPERIGTSDSTRGISGGAAITIITHSVPSRAAERGNPQLTTRNDSSSGASSERRRLSMSFSRPVHGILRDTIHGSSCQSPRVQRWVRLAETS